MARPFKSYRTASGRTITQILESYGKPAAQSMARQLYREATGIMAASQGLVPVDTAALRSSGYVAPPVIQGGRVRVEFGYGGPAARINSKTGTSTDGYALFVHENLEAFHKVGGAKFLEMPFDQAKAGMSARIAKGMRADLAGTGSDVVQGVADEGNT